jgi:hypothetical protein
MANEAGDMKLLGNFRKLIDLLKSEPTYAPPNSKIATAAMDVQYGAALAAVQDVGSKIAPNKVAISERQSAFDKLPAIVTRSRNVLKASGASKAIIDDAETSLRKVLGRRKSPKVKDNPATPANEASANHSSAQTSFENQVGNYGAYLAILGAVPEYQPNDAALKLTALTTFKTDLQAKNDAVSATFVPLSQARGLRDQLLYLSADNVVDTALLAKAYVAGEFGTNSNVYKQIKGLKFQRRLLS